MIDLILTNTHLLQCDGATVRVLHNYDILIDHGRIVATEPVGRVEPAQARAILDATGLLAMPGLTNAHCHTAMTLLRGAAEDVPIARWFNDYIWPLESHLTEEDVYWGTMLGLAEMIEAGVTTVADHYFCMDAVARAVEQSGMRAVLAWAVFGGDDDGARTRLEQTIAFAERWQGGAGGRITTVLGPHSPYTCTEAFLRQVARRARERDLGIHLHLAETRAQLARSLATTGRTPVALMRDYGVFEVPCIAAHVAHPAENDLAILRGGDVGVVICPRTELKLGIGVAPVVEYRAAGIAVGLGSDGPASSNTLDILDQARLLALFAKHDRGDATVLPIPEALAIAFEGGPRALGLDDRVGRLVPGARADIALLRMEATHLWPQHNPGANLLYSARPEDIDTVLVDGRVLMRDRQLQTIDKAEVLREVATRVERLARAAPGQAAQTYAV